jgi:tetratricopeptide (TPR) repeat protein
VPRHGLPPLTAAMWWSPGKHEMPIPLAARLLLANTVAMTDTSIVEDTPKGWSTSRILATIFAAMVPLWAVAGGGAYVAWHPMQCLSVEPSVTSASCAAALDGVLAKGAFRQTITNKYVGRLRAEEKYAEAKAFLLSEIKNGHDSVANEVALGEMASSEEDYAAAAQFYVKAYRLDPSQTGNLGSALYSVTSVNDYKSAEALVDDYLRSSPDNAYGLDWKAWIKKQQGQHQEAVAIYSSAIKIDASTASYYRDRAESYGKLRQYKEQLLDLDKLVILERNAMNLHTRGRYYWDRADYIHALADLKEAQKLEPEIYRQIQVIDISLEAKMFEEADLLLLEMIKDKPEDLSTWESACSVAIAKADWTAAAAAIDKSRKLETTEYKPSLTCAARIAEAKQDWLATIAANKLVLAQNEYDVRARREIGHALIELKLPGAALRWFDEAIARGEYDAENYASRARAYIRLERWDKAMADADKAISLSPEWGQGYARRAHIHERRAKFDLALKDYETALLLNPSIDWLREDYAKLLETTGQKEKAAKLRAEQP